MNWFIGFPCRLRKINAGDCCGESGYLDAMGEIIVWRRRVLYVVGGQRGGQFGFKKSACLNQSDEEYNTSYCEGHHSGLNESDHIVCERFCQTVQGHVANDWPVRLSTRSRCATPTSLVMPATIIGRPAPWVIDKTSRRY